MGKLIVLVSSVLFISGICSMVEAAILSVSLIKARILFEEERKGAKTLLFIKENIHLAVATIVIINNAINIVGSIFVGQAVTYIFGSRWLGLASAIITFCIIVISEVIPKTLGEYYKVRVSLMSARPLSILIWLLRPIVGVLVAIASPFKRKSSLPKITEEEIKIMLSLGRRAGTVEADEETLCNRVFRLNDLKASQMMRSIKNIYMLGADKSLLHAKEDILNSPYSRIAVYKGAISNIIGICQQRILLREIAKDNYEAKVEEFMSRPIFVYEDEKADTLLDKFQAYHQHLFIVRNAQNVNIGILTMEDVLEELFGEIHDEKEAASE
ncbi:MAG: CNNM domain-containing protein [Planctomycetota bacterium]|jgi:CBS domain containing-hemolysin-like protein